MRCYINPEDLETLYRNGYHVISKAKAEKVFQKSALEWTQIHLIWLLTREGSGISWWYVEERVFKIIDGNLTITKSKEHPEKGYLYLKDAINFVEELIK